MVYYMKLELSQLGREALNVLLPKGGENFKGRKSMRWGRNFPYK